MSARGTLRGRAAYRLVLLDRDGVLNVHRPGYVTSPDGLEMIPGAAAAVARLNAAGLLVAVVTNQRGVARGLMSTDDLYAVHARLRAHLAAAGAHLDALEVCPHEAGTCDCRKPAPGLLLQAMRTLGVDASEALLVGDQPTDTAAAHAAGVDAVRVGPGQRLPALADVVERFLAGRPVAVDRVPPQ